MRVSVVILNWNRPGDTLLAVRSVLAQDHGDFEVLVWDNASSDDSLSVLRREFGADPRVRLHAGDANYGVAGGRNRAFPLARGELLVSLDSDAVFEAPDGLRRMDERFRSDPKIGVISFEVRRPNGEVLWPFARPLADWRAREFETIRMDGCAFALPRRVFDELGGFPEHFSPFGAEDQHLAFRALGAGYRVLYFPQVAVTHAFSGAGRHGRQFQMHIRNMLWTPLEVFPMPHALLSFAKLSAGFLRDAVEYREWPAFFKGVGGALFGFRPSRRRPMTRAGWREFRRLVDEDKRLAVPH